MFDKTLYVKNVTHQSNNYSFQQVAGSLLKTHEDSVFIRFDKTSKLEGTVFSSEPRMCVKVGRNCYDESKCDYRPVTVLQVLLAHDSSYVCEVVIHYKPGDEQYKEPSKEE